MRAEVSAFVARGIDLDDACRIVGYPRDGFGGAVSEADSIKSVPTPAEITAIAAKIRSGEIVVTKRSQQRWQQFNAKIEAGQREPDDAYSLAGTIAADVCTVPAWLYSGGHANSETKTD